MLVLAFGWTPDQLDRLTATEIDRRWRPLAQLAIKHRASRIII
jgi:hypothetical protein